jgi:hypothetical protein
MAASTDTVRDGLLKLLHLLYEKDILEEVTILKRYNSGDKSSAAAALRKQVMSTGCIMKVWNSRQNMFSLQYLFQVCPLPVIRHVFR